METTKPSILEVDIKNFRAIKKAHIRIDGITVVTGENSCGKSTISKLLYYLLKISNHYDKFVQDTLGRRMWRIRRLLEDFREDEPRSIRGFHAKLQDIRRDPALEKENLIDIIQKCQKYVSEHKNDEGLSREIYRLKYLVSREFKDYVQDKDMGKGNVFAVLKNILIEIYAEYENNIRQRAKNLFEKKLRNIYDEPLKDFSAREYGVPILSKEKDRLENFQAITTAIYIDSPMAVEHSRYERRIFNSILEIDEFSHWEDLNFHLKNKNQRQVEAIRDTEIYNELQTLFASKEILNGDVAEEQDELIYHRNDGKSFKVKDCATGIKAIAALQTLYKNGWLTHKTLLILDEPEAHLHPQWIVEYARLIVLLNKEVGVNFCISSHNPDMISAIQDICDKEELNDNLRFYLAEKQDNNMYNFEDKGIDEEDIFESFNIAIDKINKYGGDDA